MEKIVGILGGSFNPVHNGHIMLARYLREHSHLNEVWLTLSPQNPLKDATTLISDVHRFSMLQCATNEIDGVGVCDIELSLPRPSYTINTLDELTKRYPHIKFQLVIGGDNWNIIHKWKDYQRIIEEYGVVVYPRPGYDIQPINHKNVVMVDAPLADVSSTQIRSFISSRKEVSEFLPQSVLNYIEENKLYK